MGLYFLPCEPQQVVLQHGSQSATLYIYAFSLNLCLFSFLQGTGGGSSPDKVKRLDLSL